MNGSVKNKKSGYILKELQFKNGYFGYNFGINRKTFQRTTHRLVALTFITNPLNLPTVNHKDLNKGNNKVDNLEWASYTDQINHYYNNCKNKKKQKGQLIVQMTKENKIIKQFISINDAAKELNIDPKSISKCCKNDKKYKTSGNYIFFTEKCPIFQ